MFEIKVSKEIKDACPVFAGAAVYAVVKNTAYSEGLWQEIDAFTKQRVRAAARPIHHTRKPGTYIEPVEPM